MLGMRHHNYLSSRSKSDSTPSELCTDDNTKGVRLPIRRLLALHEGNFARYRIRAAEFQVAEGLDGRQGVAYQSSEKTSSAVSAFRIRSDQRLIAGSSACSTCRR